MSDPTGIRVAARPISNKSNSNNILLIEKMHNVVKYEEKLESLVGSHFMAGAEPEPELISYESYKKGYQDALWQYYSTKYGKA